MIDRMLLLAACITVGLAACQGIARTDGYDEIAGIYYLLKVDGAAVPATVSHDGAALEVRSGTFIISADGTCFSRTVFVPPGGDAMTREARARLRAEGTRLIMQWDGAGTTTGFVEGDRFVMDNHGMTLEYASGQ